VPEVDGESLQEDILAHLLVKTIIVHDHPLIYRQDEILWERHAHSICKPLRIQHLTEALSVQQEALSRDFGMLPEERLQLWYRVLAADVDEDLRRVNGRPGQCQHDAGSCSKRRQHDGPVCQPPRPPPLPALHQGSTKP